VAQRSAVKVSLGLADKSSNDGDRHTNIARGRVQTLISSADAIEERLSSYRSVSLTVDAISIAAKTNVLGHQSGCRLLCAAGASSVRRILPTQAKNG